MALNGRITIDALFQETDGTTSLKIVSLEDTKNYTTGKVAIVSGTVGTAGVELWSVGNGLQFGGYKDSSGNAVTFSGVSRIALKGNGNGVEVKDIDLNTVELVSIGGDLAVGNNIGQNLFVLSLGGTASFTAILYGA